MFPWGDRQVRVRRPVVTRWGGDCLGEAAERNEPAGAPSRWLDLGGGGLWGAVAADGQAGGPGSRRP